MEVWLSRLSAIRYLSIHAAGDPANDGVEREANFVVGADALTARYGPRPVTTHAP